MTGTLPPADRWVALEGQEEVFLFFFKVCERVRYIYIQVLLITCTVINKTCYCSDPHSNRQQLDEYKAQQTH